MICGQGINHGFTRQEIDQTRHQKALVHHLVTFLRSLECVYPRYIFRQSDVPEHQGNLVQPCSDRRLLHPRDNWTLLSECCL